MQAIKRAHNMDVTYDQHKSDPHYLRSQARCVNSIKKEKYAGQESFSKELLCMQVCMRIHLI